MSLSRERSESGNYHRSCYTLYIQLAVLRVRVITLTHAIAKSTEHSLNISLICTSYFSSYTPPHPLTHPTHTPTPHTHSVVVMLCGGNIDTTVLGRSLERGLAADGRLVRFCVCLKDRPGSLCDLTKLLREHNASVKDIEHERTWLKGSIYDVEVLVCVVWCGCVCGCDLMYHRNYPDGFFCSVLLVMHALLTKSPHYNYNYMYRLTPPPPTLTDISSVRTLTDISSMCTD